MASYKLSGNLNLSPKLSLKIQTKPLSHFVNDNVPTTLRTLVWVISLFDELFYKQASMTMRIPEDVQCDGQQNVSACCCDVHIRFRTLLSVHWCPVCLFNMQIEIRGGGISCEICTLLLPFGLEMKSKQKVQMFQAKLLLNCEFYLLHPFWYIEVT